MAFLNMEIHLRIYDSYSLKDKRSTVKSIINRLNQRYNVSIAEVGEQDMLNVAHMGIAIASSSARICQQVFDQIAADVENQYEVEIFEMIEYQTGRV